MEIKTCTIDASGHISQNLNLSCLCSYDFMDIPYGSFFAKSPVFISRKIIQNIEQSISVLEKTIQSKEFKMEVFEENYSHFKNEIIDGGIFMSYDFHLDGDVPKLIEINTNAGGIFLNYELLKITKDCCHLSEIQNVDSFEDNIISMFREEFSLRNGNNNLENVAIIDIRPEEQFLYPDFLMCKKVLEKNGINVFILDPKDIKVKEGCAYFGEIKIDFIYNRLTDFSFRDEDNIKFKLLDKKNGTVISPNSLDHKLFANKSNFTYFQDDSLIDNILSSDEKTLLKSVIPETVIVNKNTEEYLWTHRKKYFFKPVDGFGGKGSYNGRGLTKGVWENITKGNYIAQETISPPTKLVQVGENKELYKFDIRAYTYRGNILLIAARMYQGQTTNFRTTGGGFSPIIITEK